MSRVSGDLDQASLLRMFMSKWQGSDVSPNAATFEIAMREAASQNETHESERRLREDMIPSTGDGRIGSDNPAPDVNEDVVSTGVAKHTPRADNGEGRIGSENSGPAPQAPQTASPQTPADKANAPAAPKIQAPAALQKGALKISFVSTASASDAPAVAPKATMPVVSSKVPAPLAPKAAPAIATPAAAEHAALRPAPLAKAHAAATIVAANPEAVTKPANASRDTRFRWPMNIESLETFAPVEDAPVTAPKPAVSRDEAAAIARVVRDLMNNRPIEARPAAAASVETPDDTTEPAAETRQPAARPDRPAPAFQNARAARQAPADTAPKASPAVAMNAKADAGAARVAARPTGTPTPVVAAGNRAARSAVRVAAPLMPAEKPGARMAARVERVTAAFEKTVQGIARLAAGGGGRTVIHLRPANLGTIRLEVRVEHAVATASAIVETTAVRSAIEQNMHELRATLAEQGIRLDQFDVRDGSARQHAEADPRAFDEAPLPARAASIAPEEETDLRPAARRHPGRVSVTV